MTRTPDLLITKSSKGPENADFRRFRGLFARCQMVSGSLISTVSVRSFPRVGQRVGQNGFRRFHQSKSVMLKLQAPYDVWSFEFMMQTMF